MILFTITSLTEIGQEDYSDSPLPTIISVPRYVSTYSLQVSMFVNFSI